MARKGTALAVVIGSAIAIGAVVAFASSSKKKDDADELEVEEEEETETPSPVLQPTGTAPPLTIPISFPTTTTQSPGQPPIKPPVTPTPAEPGKVPPIVELPDEDEDEDEDEAPTINLPGGIKVQVPDGVTVPSIPGITTAPETPAAVPAPPTPAVEQPSTVPADTATLAAQMLADEASANWKKKYAALKTWQSARSLVADGMYGVKSATRMAQEIGTLPIIRYWPKGSTRETALEPYRTTILSIAAQAPEPRKAQLTMSANREQGQSFTAPNSPIKTLVTLKAAAA